MKEIDITLNLTPTRIKIIHKGEVVLDELASIAKQGEKTVAVGNDTVNVSNMQIISPLNDGIICDYNNTKEIVKRLVCKAFGKGKKFNMCIVTPFATEVELCALEDIAREAGAERVHIAQS